MATDFGVRVGGARTQPRAAALFVRRRRTEACMVCSSHCWAEILRESLAGRESTLAMHATEDEEAAVAHLHGRTKR